MSSSKADSQQNTDQQYKELKNRLIETMQFPDDYTFKFIVPNDPQHYAEVIKILDDYKPKLSTRESSSAKYISISAEVRVFSADEIIEVYQLMSQVDGIMML